jgi:hypothetical protein
MSDEKAGQLFKTILAYVNDQDPVIDDLLIEIAFEPIRQSLKRDLKKWEGELENKSIGGRVGNLKRWNIDLYNKFSKKEITLEEAESIVLSRKTPQIDTDKNNQIQSDTDTEHRIASDSIASIAVNDTVSVSVNVSEELNISFDVFWDLYDKKRGDKDKLIKKWALLKPIDREEIIKHIPLYKLSQPDKNFRKDPQTYLNNKSWKDEIIGVGTVSKVEPEFKDQAVGHDDFFMSHLKN